MSEYVKCITPWMRGEKEIEPGITAMCVGAKLCTGKAKTKEEAVEICKNQPIRATPRGRGAKGAKCIANIDNLVDCMMGKINFQAKDLKAEVRKAISYCVCGVKVTRNSQAEAALKTMPKEVWDALGSLKGIWGENKPKGSDETIGA